MEEDIYNFPRNHPCFLLFLCLPLCLETSLARMESMVEYDGMEEKGAQYNTFMEQSISQSNHNHLHSL